jgi:hypothetical protein
MTGRHSSYFGSDGYEDLAMRDELLGQKNAHKNSRASTKEHREKEKELDSLRKRERALKNRDERSSKTLLPRSSGARKRGYS